MLWVDGWRRLEDKQESFVRVLTAQSVSTWENSQEKDCLAKENILRYFRTIPFDLISIVHDYQTQLTTISSPIVEKRQIEGSGTENFLPFVQPDLNSELSFDVDLRDKTEVQVSLERKVEKLKWPISSDWSP